MRNPVFSWAVAVWVAAWPAARGETWAEWMSPPADAPLTAEFQPGWAWDPEQTTGINRVEDHLPINRGYEGTLVFGIRPGAEAPQGPVEVTLSFSAASPAEMNWPPSNAVPADFEPMVLPQAVPRPAAWEETRTLAAEYPLRVPVVRPWNCQGPIRYRTLKPAALFGRYWVRDAAGRELCRGMLPATTLSGGAPALAGFATADEALNQVSKSVGLLTRVSDLPDELAAYREMRGIWFTEALWQQMAGREALLRRILLSGVRISGETALVERIGAALGTAKEGLVPGGGLSPEPWSSRNDASLRQLNLWSGTADRRTGRESCIFENDVDLFRTDRNAYLIWTLGGVLAFSAGVAVLLGVVFIRYKGERRVAIWLALPGWAALCFAAVWAGGGLVLERRPRADVTEYRLAVAGWPEMHCRAVATAMTFTPGRPEWKLPAGALVWGERYAGLDGWWKRYDVRTTADGMRLWLPRKMTGTALELEASWFEPTAVPVVLEGGTAEASGREVVATEDVDGVFAMIETEWRELGPMKAGERLDPRSGRKCEWNHLPGMPKVLEDEFPYEHGGGNTCRNPAHDHGPEMKRLPREHDWILVAWKRDVPPRMVPVWEETLTKGRVVWVIQCR